MPVLLHHAVLSCVVTSRHDRTHLNERAYARDALLANRASQGDATRNSLSLSARLATLHNQQR